VSQEELQRVAVITAGEVACARAAELLCLSVRQIKRLRKRMREDGEAALAHASRGRPSPRRLPARMRERILHLARTQRPTMSVNVASSSHFRRTTNSSRK
jgi:transposase